MTWHGSPRLSPTTEQLVPAAAGNEGMVHAARPRALHYGHPTVEGVFPSGYLDSPRQSHEMGSR